MVKVGFLLAKLVPDGENRLRASLYVEFQSGSLKTLFHRSDKPGDIGVAHSLALVKAAGYLGIGLAVGVFERHILQLRLYGIKPQSVCQRRI